MSKENYSFPSEAELKEIREKTSNPNYPYKNKIFSPNASAEENRLNKIGILFEEPKENKREWKKLRGYYDRKEHKIYISLERESGALI